jgi:putative membrane protein
MMKFITNLLIMWAVLLLVDYVVPGVTIDGYVAAISVAFVVGLLNATLGPILKLITFPLNILTLGLTSWVINICMILLADRWLPGFETDGFWSVVWFALALGVLRMLLGWVRSDSKDK